MQNTTSCQVDECPKLAHKRGYCNAHYQSERRAGRLDRINGDACSVEGCDVMASARGMCNKHYRRLLAHGDPHALVKKPVKRTETHKECVSCRDLLPYEAFNRASRMKDGRQAMCRVCTKKASGSWYDANRAKAREDAQRWNRENPDRAADHHYKARYGITFAEYEAKLQSQSGKCAICDREQVDGRRLYVDHNHHTGLVRDLLCRSCNSGLGNFREDRALLISAMSYLERHGTD